MDDISSIKGVEEVWPVMTNATTFVKYNVTEIYNGQNVTFAATYESARSAVIGGTNGFPTSLLTLASGRYPDSVQPEMVFNGRLLLGWHVNDTYYVDIGCLTCYGSATSHGNVTGQFNVTAVGVTAANPLLSDVFILWNSTYLENLLGPTLYNQTFLGNDQSYADFIIVKVDNLQDVQPVVTALQGILVPYPLFGTTSNQALKASLLSYRGLTGPVYEILGWASLISVAAIVFLVAYIVVGRRTWEAGLVLAEGWSWRKVLQYYWFYLTLMGGIALALAIPIATNLIGSFGASYNVYGETIQFAAYVDPLYVGTAVVLIVFASSLSSLLFVRRMKRLGLDGILREY
jgi:ABC-type antimicrobial peptide transport system permease subunit